MGVIDPLFFVQTIHMKIDTEKKTMELLKQLERHFLNVGEIIDQNGIKMPDTNLEIYMDIRDLILEIEQVKNQTK